jgi:regulator of cell morphogenesis and NO signaling
MSHQPNVFSPPGTPLPDRTVGELVAERLGRSRVFQSFQIDFCCQGGRTVREACKRKGVALDAVIGLKVPPACGRPGFPKRQITKT